MNPLDKIKAAVDNRNQPQKGSGNIIRGIKPNDCRLIKPPQSKSEDSGEGEEGGNQGGGGGSGGEGSGKGGDSCEVPSYEIAPEPDKGDWGDFLRPGDIGSTGDEEIDKMIKDYNESITSDLDDSKDETMEDVEKSKQSGESSDGEESGDVAGQDGDGAEGDGEGEDGAIVKSNSRKAGNGVGNRDLVIHKTDKEIRHGEAVTKGGFTEKDWNIFRVRQDNNRKKALSHPKFPVTALKKAKGKSVKGDTGKGLLGEFAAIGYHPPQTGLWKQILKKWIASKMVEKEGSSWIHPNPKYSHAINQLKSQGSNARMKNQESRYPRGDKFQILAFVDVSGSVFNSQIQSEFAKVLQGVPKDKAEVLIWSFDSSIQEGPFTPNDYHPRKGGGGTDCFGSVTTILSDPKYRSPDGVVFLTDGFFSAAPDFGLSPRKQCFVLTKVNEKSALPAGCKILDTSIGE